MLELVAALMQDKKSYTLKEIYYWMLINMELRGKKEFSLEKITCRVPGIFIIVLF